VNSHATVDESIMVQAAGQVSTPSAYGPNGRFSVAPGDVAPAEP
jgi:hypothetical protein